MTYSLYFDPRDDTYVVYGLSTDRKHGRFISTAAPKSVNYWTTIPPTRTNYFRYADDSPSTDFNDSLQVIATFPTLSAYFTWIQSHPELLI